MTYFDCFMAASATFAMGWFMVRNPFARRGQPCIESGHVMRVRRESRPFRILPTFGLIAVALLVETASAQNLVVNGDFESGNKGFTTGYALGDVSGPGAYNIGTNPSSAPGAFGDWCNCGDHTSGSGMMMIVNGATSAAVPVWHEVVHVAPSTNYRFSYWGAEVDHVSNSLPHLAVKINGRMIGSSHFPQNSPDNGGQWQNFSFTWNSGSSHTADLVLADLDTDATWNDFALDDISFAPADTSAGASSAGPNRSIPSPITTDATVTVQDSNGTTIPLQQPEKVALMFMQAISFMEDGCLNGLKRRCPLAELVAGVNSPNWRVGKLRFDPASDPNYKYTITISGKIWTASAVPQHPGLGGFFVEGAGRISADTYYKRNGAATDSDIALSSIGVGGDSFQVQ
jgi:hypothetical protein